MIFRILMNRRIMSMYHEVFLCELVHKRRGRIVSWHSSSTAALHELRRIKREMGDDSMEVSSGVKCIRVPSDRSGLILWLNEHANNCKKPPSLKVVAGGKR